MSAITIDGIGLPEPSSLRIPNFDLDSENTGRNELGILQRDRIRQGIFKIELEWKMINSSELATIKAATQPASFQVTFPSETGYVTKTMYAGDRNVEMAVYHSDYNKIKWNISFNLTEY